MTAFTAATDEYTEVKKQKVGVISFKNYDNNTHSYKKLKCRISAE